MCHGKKERDGATGYFENGGEKKFNLVAEKTERISGKVKRRREGRRKGGAQQVEKYF